jgi:hypothetical protein
MSNKQRTKATITEMKKSVIADGGTFEKQSHYLNGKNCWRVNGKLLTKSGMQEEYQSGKLHRSINHA